MKQKIKIMNHKPELSDEEIRSYMDFNGLIATRKLKKGETDRLDWLKRIVPVIAISTIAVWLIFYSDTATKPQPAAETTQQIPEELPEGKEPVIFNESVKEDKLMHKQPETSESTSKDKQKSKGSIVQQENKPLESLYTQAEPMEGYDALYEYFNSHLVYPAEGVQDSIQGVQTISFVINSNGKPENIQIKQSLGEPFEKEARRLIENMPGWKPAALNGKPVSSQVSLPLTFQIKKVKTR